MHGGWWWCFIIFYLISAPVRGPLAWRVLLRVWASLVGVCVVLFLFVCWLHVKNILACDRKFAFQSAAGNII